MISTTPYELPSIDSPKRQLVARTVPSLATPHEHGTSQANASAALPSPFSAVAAKGDPSSLSRRRQQTSPGWSARPLGVISGKLPASKSPESDTLAKIRQEMAAQFQQRGEPLRREPPVVREETTQLAERKDEKRTPEEEAAKTNGDIESKLSSSSAPVIAPAPSTSTTASQVDVDRQGTALKVSEENDSRRHEAAPGRKPTAEDVSRLQEIAMRQTRTGVPKQLKSTRQQSKVRGRAPMQRAPIHTAGPLTSWDVYGTPTLSSSRRSADQPPLTSMRKALRQSAIEHTANKEVPQLEYLSFVGSAALNPRIFTQDKRDGLVWIPCERCRQKGGRCSGCKAIRVGGGYIILHPGDLDNDDIAYLKSTRGLHQGKDGKLQLSSRPGTGFRAGWKVAGNTDEEKDLINGPPDRSQGDGEGGESVGNGQGGAGDLEEDEFDEHGNPTGSSRSKSRTGRSSGLRGDDENASQGGRARSSRGRSGLSPRGGTPSALATDLNGGDGDGGAQGRVHLSRLGDNNDESGRQSGNRAYGDGNGENVGVASAADGEGDGKSKKFGKDRGPHGRLLREAEEGKGGYMSAGQQRSGRSPAATTGRFLAPENQNDNSKDNALQNRLKSAPPGPRDEDEKRGRKGLMKIDGEDWNSSDEELAKDPRARGKLRKFKKRNHDAIGAKECDWKDLKGIDPLDYLAKYCIVDKDRIPTYERIYHNVDLYEEDDITIEQLDFALKAVNNNLISDPEMDYVFHILELARRPKLNFKLFCLVAALSERVVMLEDMVKKLIHKMDFEALEVKMKKCKELFYLLADMETGFGGGVVTTGNLAIELTAGGLTPEHVKLVVDHLNSEKKGIINFLDYLTYVPLFLEIHGSIVSNPLDQKRDK